MTTINLGWITNLNAIAKIIKLPEENMGKSTKIFVLLRCSDFLERI